VEKKSGYRALHCDRTLFDPRFDKSISGTVTSVSVDPYEIFSVLTPEDTDLEVLQKLKDYFNVEIQLHTTFESLWSTMEHMSNYNIQAKGKGRNSKITVQWKMLADNMQNLEKQFERLQIDTEQARFEVSHHEEYMSIKHILDQHGSDIYPIHVASAKKMEDLENDLKSHEISRQDYVEALQKEARYIGDFASQQKDPSVQIIFKMHRAFIYYGLANQSKYFNTEDIHEFVKKALQSYKDISQFLSSHPEIEMDKQMNIVAVYRYLYLSQKHGLGLMDPEEKTFMEEDVQVVSYADNLSMFETGISLLNTLGREELKGLKNESAKVMKILHHYDVMAREWELFAKEDDSVQNADLRKQITHFRERFITLPIQEQFQRLLESDKIKNIGFVVNFYTSLVWHGFLRPRDALKQIIKYSAYDKIEASDLFYYELAAYRFLIIQGCESISDCDKDMTERQSDPVKLEHYGNYHRKNMIQLLFRIRKEESVYKFHKARLYFEQLTQSKFKIDHFSDMMRK
jgi:hypothetical protein